MRLEQRCCSCSAAIRYAGFYRSRGGWRDPGVFYLARAIRLAGSARGGRGVHSVSFIVRAVGVVSIGQGVVCWNRCQATAAYDCAGYGGRNRRHEAVPRHAWEVEIELEGLAVLHRDCVPVRRFVAILKLV